MCFLETAAVARSVRRSDEPPIDNDQELAANGIACIAGAFFRAMPSAGGFSQTAINQRAGARTQLSELVTALLAVLCALFLGGVLSDLPQATLGLPGRGRRARPDQAGRVRALLAPQPHRVLGRRDHRRRRAGASGCSSRCSSGCCSRCSSCSASSTASASPSCKPTPDGDDVRVAGTHTTPIPGLLILRFDGPLYTANVRGANRRMLAAVDEAERPTRSCSTPPPSRELPRHRRRRAPGAASASWRPVT